MRARIDLALNGRHHVVGVEGLALVEFYALAQLEAPAVRLDNLPGRRQRRLKLQVLVAADERIEDHVLDALGEAVDLRIGVVGNDVAGGRPAKRLG
ncbi:hypothetical protein ACVMB3_004289 [Sinorhizobium meliloti]